MFTGEICTKPGLSLCLRGIVLIILIMTPFALQSEGMKQGPSFTKNKLPTVAPTTRIIKLIPQMTKDNINFVSGNKSPKEEKVKIYKKKMKCEIKCCSSNTYGWP